MRESNPSSRLLGYVQLRVGETVIAVPVESVTLEPDGCAHPGGFYAQGSQLGIYVDAEAPQAEVEDQIRRASNDAVRHLARKLLN
jgi:hypothetical protein